MDLRPWIPLALAAACTPVGGIAPSGAPGGLTDSPSLPEIPASLPDLTMVEEGRYTHPTLPPHRTTQDGRVGMELKYANLVLMGPEVVDAPLSVSGGGTHGVLEKQILDPEVFFDVAALVDAGHTQIEAIHRTVCDPIVTAAPISGTPIPCGEADCYDFDVITLVGSIDGDGVRQVQAWSAPVAVTIAQPKTRSAHITSWEVGGPSAGPVAYADQAFEPTFTEDGQLLVLRLAKSTRDPNTGDPRPGVVDVVYAVIPEGGTPCALSELGPWQLLSHAHHDPDLRGRYGIATHPLRDPEGALIPDGVDAKISYPWIDRRGANLFFTAVGATNGVEIDGVATHRYPSVCAHPALCEGILGVGSEPLRNFRGLGVVGAWTRGKMVLLDGPLNNVDYGVLRRTGGHLDLQLYTPDTQIDPTVRGDGWIEVGSSREISDLDVPRLATENTNFIDSIEALWNYDPHLAPTRIRDVVWTVNTGRGSAPVVFDDYLDPDILVLAEMVGASSHPEGASRHLRYYDGFVQPDPTDWRIEAIGSEHVRIQNAATTTRWAVPASGRIVGEARLEPVAAGGIEGKGLWLDGEARLSFLLPPQPRGDLSTQAFFVSAFFDARFDDDGLHRALVGLPDGSGLWAHGRSVLALHDGSGAAVASVDLASLALAPGIWRHLGLRVDPDADEIQLFVDGYAWVRWSGIDPPVLIPGPLDLGGGFRGWVDDFKVIVGPLELEVVCNHARGTLIGLDGEGTWDPIATLYPDHDDIHDALIARGQPVHARYACWHDPTDPTAVRPDNVPLGAVSLRASLLFPEGPLVHDLPRPDSSANPFCLSCHTDPVGTLSVEALIGDPDLSMRDDPRRQPMQPRRILFGHVPRDFFGPGRPEAPLDAPHTFVDPYLAP